MLVSKCILPMFFSSFVVLVLTFKSFIHFEFIFACSARSCLILSHFALLFSQHHLLKKLFSPHFIFLPLLSQINCPYKYGFISVPVPYYFDYCDFVVQFEIRECYISSFLSQDSFVYRGSLVFPYKFQNYLLQFCEKFCRYFDKDCIKLFCLGQYVDFIISPATSITMAYFPTSLGLMFSLPRRFYKFLFIFLTNLFLRILQSFHYYE